MVSGYSRMLRGPKYCQNRQPRAPRPSRAYVPRVNACPSGYKSRREGARGESLSKGELRAIRWHYKPELPSGYVQSGFTGKSYGRPMEDEDGDIFLPVHSYEDGESCGVRYVLAHPVMFRGRQNLRCVKCGSELFFGRNMAGQQPGLYSCARCESIHDVSGLNRHGAYGSKDK